MSHYKYANIRCANCGRITRIVDNTTGEGWQLAHRKDCPAARS